MSPIFDFHARLGPGTVPSALLTSMDAAGIARAAVCAGCVVDLDQLSAQIVDGGRLDAGADNAAVLAACAGSGGRLVPFFFANPFDPVADYRRVAGDYRGLELSPAVHGVALDDPRTLALVEVAEAAGHPVYLVCLGRPGARTADLLTLARSFPDVAFVFGHCGFFGIDTCSIGQIAPQTNILAETSGCFTAVARVAIERLGPDRVLFGTEYPLQHPGVELAKLAALDLDPAARHAVAWANAHRILGERLS